MLQRARLRRLLLTSALNGNINGHEFCKTQLDDVIRVFYWPLPDVMVGWIFTPVSSLGSPGQVYQPEDPLS
jgi:hypothetical protein